MTNSLPEFDSEKLPKEFYGTCVTKQEFRLAKAAYDKGLCVMNEATVLISCEGCRRNLPIEVMDDEHMHILPLNEHKPSGHGQPWYTAGSHIACESQEIKALLTDESERKS